MHGLTERNGSQDMSYAYPPDEFEAYEPIGIFSRISDMDEGPWRERGAFPDSDVTLYITIVNEKRQEALGEKGRESDMNILGMPRISIWPIAEYENSACRIFGRIFGLLSLL
jgi:hypothetical protein